MLTILIGGLLLSNIAHAQKRPQFLTDEDAAIAFYKTGGIVPNFERWIKQRDPYRHTQPTRRPDVFDAEMARLQQRYQAFYPRKTLIKVQTSVTVSLLQTQDDNQQPVYHIKSQFALAPDANYFPYKFLGERIIIAPDKIDQAMQGTLTALEYQNAINTSQSSKDHRMIVTMVTKKADLSKPYKIDGIDQWILVTDIISLEIWNKYGQLIWQYTKPGYLSPNAEQINKLYDLKPQKSSGIGSVKPFD